MCLLQGPSASHESAYNEPYLDSLKLSDILQQLPAYDIRGDLIQPSDYEEKLAGAISQVCFSVIHYLENKFFTESCKVAKKLDRCNQPFPFFHSSFKQLFYLSFLPSSIVQYLLLVLATFKSTYHLFPTDKQSHFLFLHLPPRYTRCLPSMCGRHSYNTKGSRCHWRDLHNGHLEKR